MTPPARRNWTTPSSSTFRRSRGEWGRIVQLLTQLRHELQENDDSPALRNVILGYIRLILEYCQRIYLRQLSQEDKTSSDFLKRFPNLLREYYLDGRQMDLGVPSVQYCADRLAYSPRYLGDVIHKSTGITPTEFLFSSRRGSVSQKISNFAPWNIFQSSDTTR